MKLNDGSPKILDESVMPAFEDLLLFLWRYFSQMHVRPFALDQNVLANYHDHQG